LKNILTNLKIYVLAKKNWEKMAEVSRADINYDLCKLSLDFKSFKSHLINYLNSKEVLNAYGLVDEKLSDILRGYNNGKKVKEIGDEISEDIRKKRPNLSPDTQEERAAMYEFWQKQENIDSSPKRTL
jgi:hypothetical protein